MAAAVAWRPPRRHKIVKYQQTRHNAGSYSTPREIKARIARGRHLPGSRPSNNCAAIQVAGRAAVGGGAEAITRHLEGESGNAGKATIIGTKRASTSETHVGKLDRLNRENRSAARRSFSVAVI